MSLPNDLHAKARATAVQTLNSNNQVIRYGWCKEHGERSSQYLGADHHGWMFRCRENKQHVSHLFYVRPDPKAPKTVDETKAWMERMLVARATETKGQ